MSKLEVMTNPAVESVFRNYPPAVRKKIENLRSLILEVANELDEVSSLEETLKWGEPSYLTKHGSTIRIDWKKKSPNLYAMYFQCTSKLVPTFKALYHGLFKFDGNRAIIFDMEEEILRQELMKCIAAGLRYHKLKHLPMLGM